MSREDLNKHELLVPAVAVRDLEGNVVPCQLARSTARRPVVRRPAVRCGPSDARCTLTRCVLHGCGAATVVPERRTGGRCGPDAMLFSEVSAERGVAG